MSDSDQEEERQFYEYILEKIGLEVKRNQEKFIDIIQPLISYLNLEMEPHISSIKKFFYLQSTLLIILIILNSYLFYEIKLKRN